VIEGNFMHGIGRNLHGVQGVYLDGGTMGVAIDQNFFYRVGGVGNGAVNLNTSSDAMIVSNTFVECETPVQYSFTLTDASTNKFNNYISMWYDQRSEMTNSAMGAQLYAAYPLLEDFYDRIEEIDAAEGTNFPIHPCYVVDNTAEFSGVLPTSIVFAAKSIWEDRVPDAVMEQGNQILYK